MCESRAILEEIPTSHSSEDPRATGGASRDLEQVPHGSCARHFQRQRGNQSKEARDRKSSPYGQSQARAIMRRVYTDASVSIDTGRFDVHGQTKKEINPERSPASRVSPGRSSFFDCPGRSRRTDSSNRVASPSRSFRSGNVGGGALRQPVSMASRAGERTGAAARTFIAETPTYSMSPRVRHSTGSTRPPTNRSFSIGPTPVVSTLRMAGSAYSTAPGTSLAPSRRRFYGGLDAR